MNGKMDGGMDREARWIKQIHRWCVWFFLPTDIRKDMFY